MHLKITKVRKLLLIAALFIGSSISAQTTVSRIITDWQGYWSSTAVSANAAQQPDDHHNLIGFQVGSTIYSTGVNNALLSNNGLSYTAGNYKALPISGISGNAGASAYIVLGKNIDGNPNAANYLSPAVDNLTLLDVMIDGTNGLDLGTGSTNISTGAVLNFAISNIIQSKISDDEPDILITQIADPSNGTNDTFSFNDVNGQPVGNPIVVSFNSITAVGTYRMDLFTLADGAPYATATPSGNGSAGTGTRDIRVISLKLSDFGINDTNYANIANFRFSPGGASDPAFIAYNANAFLIPAPEITQQPISQVACPGTGNNVTFNVTATGTGLTYQWRKNGVDISGATSDSYTITNVEASDVAAYSVKVTNAAGSVISSTVYLNTVVAVQPVTTATCINTAAQLSFEANGLNATYQWYSNSSLSNTGGTLIPGATSTTYSPPVNAAGTFYYYSVATSDGQSCTSLASNAVAFTVNATSVAGTASANHTICSGTSTQTTLSGYTGTIQWQQSANGTSGWINAVGGSGATTATYTTPALNATTYYRARVTSGTCSVATSNTVTVTVSDTSNWTGTVSSAWNTPGNWECEIVPTLILNANIPVVASGNYPIIDGADGIANCKNITAAAGASVTINGNGTLRIAGAINNTGVINAVDGTVAMVGTSAQIIPQNTFATNYIKNLTISNNSGVSLAGELSLTGILAPQAGTFSTGNQLTLKSNVATTAMIAPVTGAISGQMTVERYIPARRAFRFLSSAVDATGIGTIRSNWQENGSDIAGWGTDITGEGAATNGFDESGSNNPSLFTYLNNNTGTENSWIAATSTNQPLLAGVPYRMMVRGDRTINQYLNASPPTVTTLRAYGNAKTGDVTYSNLTEVPGRYVFMGNPYQAPVDMQALLAASTGFATNFYQIWDPTRNIRGAYVTVNVATNTNNVSGSVADRYLQAGQAFFIQAADASQAITFKESYKHIETATAEVFRASQETAQGQIRFTLYENGALSGSGTSADGFVVLFDDSYSNSIDRLDAVKITNQDENAGILNSGKVLSFESRSLPAPSDVIPLTHSQYRNANYTYKVEVSGLGDTPAYLLDKYTNSRTLLENGAETSVPFTVNASDASAASDRFDIVFSSTLGNGETAFSDGLKVYPNPVTGNQFFIQLPTQQLGAINVKLVNLLGQEVYSKALHGSEGAVRIQPETQLQSGVYLLKITDGKQTATKKIIVK